MSDLDKECPRCKGFEAQRGTPPPTPVPPLANGGYAPPPAPPRTSGTAIASLVLGICGFLTCGLSAVVGLILGIVSLGQIRAGRGRVQGQGLAVAGIALSAGTLLLSVAMLAAIVLPTALSAGRHAKEARLRGDLKVLRLGIAMFESDCGDYPATLDQLTGAALTATVGGRGVRLRTTEYKGPYVAPGETELPKDCFTRQADWRYDAATGSVHSASDLTALDGTQYRDW
jgi:type II secretory pathway pseudopilin PulG